MLGFSDPQTLMDWLPQNHLGFYINIDLRFLLLNVLSYSLDGKQ